MARVGIVTDSTSDLSAAELEKLGVVMVPLKVLFGDETYLDWIELQPAQFYEKLALAETLPKTSQPSPADFLAVYQRLADEGCAGIVSIHVSAALSGTHESAILASKDSPVPVHVIDSKKVSQALALVVRAACAARDEGASADEVAKQATDTAGVVEIFFVLDTLEYLVKGGRAGKAQGLAANLLNIKPVLRINDEGIIEPFKKIKGRKRAVSELAAHVAAEAARLGTLRVGVLHGCAADDGAELLGALHESGADLRYEPTSEVGAVVGTYAGPNAIGVAFHPER